MKAAAFFLGLIVVFAGVEPEPTTSIWMILPVVFTGLTLMWWSILPKSIKNRYVK